MNEDSKQNNKGTSNKNQAKDREKLEFCFEIGKIAYEQEQSRMESIKNKAENLVKYSTLILGIVNLAVSLVINGALIVNVTEIMSIMYLITVAFVLCCIITTLLTQKPSLVRIFPDGVVMIETMQVEKEDYNGKEKQLYQQILMYTECTRTLNMNNEKSIKLLRFAYVFYVLSILILAILMMYSLQIV